DPKWAGAYCTLGLALRGKERPDDAIRAFRTSIDLDPKWPPPYCHLGSLYADLGQWGEAAVVYRRALELWSASPWVCLHNVCLRVPAEDAAGYRKLCSAMLERFGPIKNVDDIAALASTCALAPQALPDPLRVVQLVQQRSAWTPPPSPHHIWSIHLLGLA